ncbi:hypothetical protein Tco_0534261 [Tanacetum coccineum]
MSQPANDDFSQHLSDGEESNHEDASDTEEYDIWAMEMEHYLEYIDNEGGWGRSGRIHSGFFFWEAIRTRFGGNANSKKMQKAIFKQQFEAFKISNSEGLEKGYDSLQHTSHLYFLQTNAPEKEVLAGFADEVIYSLFAKQTEDLDLLHEDLE